MGSKSLVICDPEERYAQALALFIMNRKGLHFLVQICNNTDLISEADILIISEIYPEEERKKISAEKVFILSEKKYSSKEGTIYKYQAGEQILEEILSQCEELYSQSEVFYSPARKKDVKVIGIFSPIHRIGKTTYAFELGQRLGETGNVLYLNMELYGGIGGHFETEGQTLEDVLYYLRQEKGNIGYILMKVVKHKGNLDYILPIPVSEDVKGIDVKEWKSLLQKIFDQSIYETIVLDIDEGIRGVYEMLRICSQIYVPIEESSFSKSKIEQFEKELKNLGYEDVMEKLEYREVEA